MITFTELLKRAESEKLAIHTPAEEQAMALLSKLDKKGYVWFGREKLTSEAFYEVEKENTCYNFEPNKKIMYGPFDWYQNECYTIIEFENIDFAEKPTKTTPKSDIKIIYQSEDKLTTCVVFNDGTKVKVEKHKGDKGSIYTAVAYAITKKTYGSNKVFAEIVDDKLYKGGK